MKRPRRGFPYDDSHGMFFLGAPLSRDSCEPLPKKKD